MHHVQCKNKMNEKRIPEYGVKFRLGELEASLVPEAQPHYSF